MTHMHITQPMPAAHALIDGIRCLAEKLAVTVHGHPFEGNRAGHGRAPILAASASRQAGYFGKAMLGAAGATKDVETISAGYSSSRSSPLLREFFDDALAAPNLKASKGYWEDYRSRNLI